MHEIRRSQPQARLVDGPSLASAPAVFPARPTSNVVPDLRPTNPAKSVKVDSPFAPDPVREKEIGKLLRAMTLQEKVMQLVMIPWDGNLTGPKPGEPPSGGSIGQLRQGAGWVLNPNTLLDARTIRKTSATETRLGIPTAIGFDVISGDYTLGPQLMGTACSFDPSLARLQGLISAREARARDLDLTFAPNVDVSKGLAPYGRAIESAGSAPFLIKQMGAANIRGFHDGKLATCAKHFAGYGQPRTGIDYGGASLSKAEYDRTLIPFKEAVANGTDTIMASFNTINGIASHENGDLFKVLRAWGFDGVVISDWTGIAELIRHGTARDRKHAAELAFKAGVDVDMSSGIYQEHLGELVKEGVVSERELDEAVRRVLRYKFRRGLFAEKLGNPNAEAEQKNILGAEHRAAVRTIAERSLVLLKNGDFGGKPALPLGVDLSRVAVVGAIADNPVAYLGHWRGRGEINGPGAEGKPTNHDHIATVKDAFEERFGKARVGYAQGNYVLERGDALMWTRAHAHALGSDAVVMVIGESAAMSGEGASITNDALPVQQHDIALAKSLHDAGHKVIVVNISGRPKPGMHALEPYCHALVQGFQPGTEAGNAIVNLLTGQRADGSLTNFSGKLSVELPREALDSFSVHHERETTGRPADVENADGKYTWGPAFYDRDGNQVTYPKPHPLHVQHKPAFPFGFGLSYSPVSYTGLVAPAKVSRRELWDKGCTLQITVRNDGERAKHEAVQAYMQLLNASENQPEKRLVGTVVVALEPGEQKQVSITIPAEEFEFASERAQGARVLEPGKALIGVGASSDPKSWQTATVEVVAERHFGKPHDIQARS